jgi:hypothetical protein
VNTLKYNLLLKVRRLVFLSSCYCGKDQVCIEPLHEWTKFSYLDMILKGWFYAVLVSE